MSAAMAGPPVSTAIRTPAAMTATECARLWGALMQANAPLASTATGDTPDYLVTTSAGKCHYTYQKNTDGDYIEYDPATGEVTTFIQ